jgi:hypothetical protein
MPGSSGGPTGYGGSGYGQPYNLRAGQGNSCMAAGPSGGGSSPLAMIALAAAAIRVLRARRRLR